MAKLLSPMIQLLSKSLNLIPVFIFLDHVKEGVRHRKRKWRKAKARKRKWRKAKARKRKWRKAKARKRKWRRVRAKAKASIPIR